MESTTVRYPSKVWIDERELGSERMTTHSSPGPFLVPHILVPGVCCPRMDSDAAALWMLYAADLALASGTPWSDFEVSAIERGLWS